MVTRCPSSAAVSAAFFGTGKMPTLHESVTIFCKPSNNTLPSINLETLRAPHLRLPSPIPASLGGAAEFASSAHTVVNGIVVTNSS
jgi:hypothetical protein